MVASKIKKNTCFHFSLEHVIKLSDNEKINFTIRYFFRVCQFLMQMGNCEFQSDHMFNSNSCFITIKKENLIELMRSCFEKPIILFISSLVFLANDCIVYNATTPCILLDLKNLTFKALSYPYFAQKKTLLKTNSSYEELR